MILKIKYQELILRVLGLVMIVLICVLVNHLESKKPEIEIRKSITGINIYTVSYTHLTLPTTPYV